MLYCECCVINDILNLLKFKSSPLIFGRIFRSQTCHPNITKITQKYQLNRKRLTLEVLFDSNQIRWILWISKSYEKPFQLYSAQLYLIFSRAPTNQAAVCTLYIAPLMHWFHGTELYTVFYLDKIHFSLFVLNCILLNTLFTSCSELCCVFHFLMKCNGLKCILHCSILSSIYMCTVYKTTL